MRPLPVLMEARERDRSFKVDWKASGEGDLEIGLLEAVADSREDWELANAEGDWLCACCHNKVANERDRFRFEGRDEFTFRNPEGIRFEIMTFSKSPGCLDAGAPTLEHTWFPGHSWNYSLCAECGQHLGWRYTGQQKFLGLIRDRLVRALYLRN